MAPSARVTLARVALAAALEVEGVVTTTSGPAGAWVTTDGEQRLEGVVCTADPAGGYELTLYVHARPVPLHRLGDRVRAVVAQRAAEAGVGGSLAGAKVVVVDVVVPAEPER